jgi:hypothetical protein
MTTRRLAKLRIDFLEVPAIDEHFSRLSSGAWRHQTIGFHHVHEPCGTAEADP